ncbi:MAG: hypothetical protein HQK54_15020 [Oligoflexales bacterium]|nr:hypothetical protein [Oligoflexales bacterium]
MGIGVGKPVIYLYPEKKKTKVNVTLDFDGDLVTTYPRYDDKIKGWEVLADPDGTLVNVSDRMEYSYIFWNGISPSFNPDLSEGFVVKGEETRKFLQDVLSKQGMTPREYNEMIVYWLPYMEHHKYNLIHFAGASYTNIAKMNIRPNPDSILRIFMAFRELKEPLAVKPQKFKPFERKGFTVVEWGGSEFGGDWKVIK